MTVQRSEHNKNEYMTIAQIFLCLCYWQYNMNGTESNFYVRNLYIILSNIFYKANKICLEVIIQWPEKYQKESRRNSNANPMPETCFIRFPFSS